MIGSTRRQFIAGAVLTGATAAAAGGCSRQGPVIHSEHALTEDTAGLTPDQALTKLKEGNDRFVTMTEIEPNVNSSRLMAVSAGQQPFVGMLGCVDSRVPPELVFDRGLGDVFDARIAGAIAADAAVGSLEFGVEEFNVPLLVVLGHSDCGAVKATVKALRSGDTDPPGQIGAVVEPIVPAVRAVEARGVTGDAVIPAAVEEVVRRGVAALVASPVLSGKLGTGALKVVGAVYELGTGRVRFLGGL